MLCYSGCEDCEDLNEIICEVTLTDSLPYLTPLGGFVGGEDDIIFINLQHQK